ncbi:MAG: hypothetical protein FD143_3259 [Ignavibacteria bacterium]|nr:MAG: hypothetical protein FD143_3259 [Ignavibacteria bacterium]
MSHQTGLVFPVRPALVVIILDFDEITRVGLRRTRVILDIFIYFN